MKALDGSKLLLLLVLVVTSAGVKALSPSEQTALTDMIAAWPVLSTVGWNSTVSAGCGFPGVVCTSDVITEIGLEATQLAGTIPSTIGNLVGLTELNLRRTALTGTIPASINALVALATLRLDVNTLSGSIPTLPPSLKTLFLASNGLTGSITPVVSLTALTTLDLSNNQLSGSIPAAISNITNLENLVFRSNALTGTLPASLSGMAKLVLLDLGINQLEGPISAVPTTLKALDLSCNNFDACSSTIALTDGLSCIVSGQSAPGTSFRTDRTCANFYRNNKCLAQDNTAAGCPRIPANCVGSAPSADFVCVSSTWISIWDVTLSQMLVSGNVVVEGNLTVTDETTFSSVESNIHLSGCASINGKIGLTLSDAALESMVKNEAEQTPVLIIQACPNGFDTKLPVELTHSPTCRKLTGSVVSSTPYTMSVDFDIKSIKCHVWWIVVLCMLGALALAILILIVVDQKLRLHRIKKSPPPAIHN